MKITYYLILACLCLSGCTILGNLDQIFTLQGYSNEKDAQHAQVKSIDDHYDLLTKAIAEGRINNYRDEASFVKSFGDPILKRDLRDGLERWLYRRAIYRLSKDAVYVYFDRNGKQVKWEKFECPKFF